MLCMIGDNVLITLTHMQHAECFVCKSENISQEAFLFCVVYLSLHTNRSHKVFNSSTAELKRAHIAR